MIRKKLGKNFIFHSNLNINPNKIKGFPTYYQDILIKWENFFSSLPSLPSCVWHNKYIKIDDKTIFSSSLSAKGINFVGQLFQNNQQIDKWDELKTDFDLIESEKFLIIQITHVLGVPQKLPKSLKNTCEKAHVLIKDHRVLLLSLLV